jgi:Na+/alanine symporter
MEEQMNAASAALSAQKPKAFLPIFIGGLVAGSLDLISAFIIYGSGVPRVIAGGLLGPKAFQGGLATYVLGVALHFFIALSATAVYYAASRKLEFLKEHALVCGLFYGIAVYLVMNLIVLPLSALHARDPLELAELIRGILVHMFCIGLPISLSVRRYSK